MSCAPIWRAWYDGEKFRGISSRTDLQQSQSRQGQHAVFVDKVFARAIAVPPGCKHRDSFLLKGALLFDLWYDVPLRPTRDIDLLGFGMAEIPHLIKVFEDLCAIEVEDGISFDAATIKAEEIRKDANYSGTRVTLVGSIDGAKCPVQVDVGYGDAVTPAPQMAT